MYKIDLMKINFEKRYYYTADYRNNNFAGLHSKGLYADSFRWKY